MGYALELPKLPGRTLDVLELDRGVALVDPDNEQAYVWAPRDQVYTVGVDRSS